MTLIPFIERPLKEIGKQVPKNECTMNVGTILEEIL